MKWSSAVSVAADLDAAIDETVSQVRDALAAPADLAAVFVSPHHERRYSELPRRLARDLGARVLIGCSAGGVIGAGHEVEESPGLSVTAAVLPDVELDPFHVADIDELMRHESWRRMLAGSSHSTPSFVLLADPYTFDAETFIQGLDAGFPASAKIGGLASGARQPGANALYVRDELHRGGLVGVALSGDVALDTLVAQGCRPIGDPMFVTRAQHNAIYALDGRAPLEVLQELHGRLEPRDRELFRHSLFVGVVMREKSDVYRQGDFLIRNIVGLDAERGALAVGALLGEGTIVQFHLRDAETSAADLEDLLSQLAPEKRAQARGSLLFSCLGRGKHLYGRVDHDTDAFRRHLGDVPLGGFFCNGEIGPVHGATFLHGYTSSFGLFRPLTLARH
ncbi:MAG TPA: FIST N-terminal domain-containing protein [Candidatus Binatia bacterium]|nr:FIST N-terminal domain-containing protein [Candidatus Binatia bacterium]